MRTDDDFRSSIHPRTVAWKLKVKLFFWPSLWRYSRSVVVTVRKQGAGEKMLVFPRLRLERHLTRDLSFVVCHILFFTSFTYTRNGAHRLKFCKCVLRKRHFHFTNFRWHPGSPMLAFGCRVRFRGREPPSTPDLLASNLARV